MQNRKNPKDPEMNWFMFECALTQFNSNTDHGIENIIIYEHSSKHCDIRITNFTKNEFDWARYQALFKNTMFCLSYFKAGQVNDQEVSVPCKNLWDFKLLSESLTKIEEYIDVEKNIVECRNWQKKLWNEWKETWAPKEIRIIADQYFYGPKE